MALRSSWEGFLQLSLISVPVRAYNAGVAGSGEFHFHQIHKNCGNRIRYKKTCPVHGEVNKDEIVSGYEYQKDQYVELDPEEIAGVRAEKDESIKIEAFVAPEKLDPIYLSGKTFYLVPEGKAGQTPFALLQRVMAEKDRYALAGMVLSGHEQRVLIRPVDKLLAVTVLYFDHQIKAASDFSVDMDAAKISPQERKLADSLVDASTTDHVDYKEYKDLFHDRVRELVEAKLAGHKVKPNQMEKTRPVINLMDALRESLNKTGSGTGQGADKKNAPRRPARSHIRLHSKSRAG